MKRMTMGIGITALLVLLLASAFAFSVTLQNLRVNALSFAQPAEAAAVEEPMTGADESAISSLDADEVRMEEFEQADDHLCRKNRLADRATDF